MENLKKILLLRTGEWGPRESAKPLIYKYSEKTEQNEDSLMRLRRKRIAKMA